MAKKTAYNPELTRQQVKDICLGQQPSKSGLGSTYLDGFSEKLNSKTMVFEFDDMAPLKYKFITGESLAWACGSSEYKDEYAQILELKSAPGIFFVNHLRSKTFPLENITLIIDTEQKLVTLIHARLGDSKRPRDVERTIHFGSISGGDINMNMRHDFTTDLVGNIYDWDYGDDFTVKHLYMNNEHMVYMLTSSHLDEKGLVEAAEADYIKIRSNVYVMTWLEKGHQGMQGLVLMDTGSMEDIGCFFGINITGRLDNFTMAAKGKESGLGKLII